MIEAQGLAKRYGSTTAVDDLDAGWTALGIAGAFLANRRGA